MKPNLKKTNLRLPLVLQFEDKSQIANSSFITLVIAGLLARKLSRRTRNVTLKVFFFIVWCGILCFVIAFRGGSGEDV